MKFCSNSNEIDCECFNMDHCCGICLKPADQLFETGDNGVVACFKCQPLVPEVTLDDASAEHCVIKIDDDGTDDLYCSLCNKMFQKSHQLQNHLRNHRAEKRFVCTYCNKAFTQSNNLRAHLRIHTNERPYKCSECGKAFTQVTNLNNHVRLHTGERPFACPEPGCNKAFAQVTNLNQHKKRHLNGRPIETSYDCNICGEQFEERRLMLNHRRESHAVKSSVSNNSLTFMQKQLSKMSQKEPEPQSSEDDNDKESDGTVPCVFSSCGARLSCSREHTEHLLRAHQLRVKHAAVTHPPRRGRPPKVEVVVVEEDPLEITVEVEHVKTEYIPKLKVENMFQ